MAQPRNLRLKIIVRYVIRCGLTVRGFRWTIQQTKFTSNMLLIPLGCCDLVLGVEWLVSLGDIVWDFNKLQMEFFVKGRRHVTLNHRAFHTFSFG